MSTPPSPQLEYGAFTFTFTSVQPKSENAFITLDRWNFALEKL